MSNYNAETPSIQQKGDFVALGATSFVELLATGDIIKRPWPGIDRAEERRIESSTEAAVYERLGSHRYLVEKKSWDPTSCALILQRMQHGTLDAYLQSHKDVPVEQRIKWAMEATERVQLLHRATVLHCDLGPHNLLLDDRLGLKIIDFSGSSIDGSPTNITPGVRYSIPTRDRVPPLTVKLDLFSLGSTIYYIMTGNHPLEELRDEEVEQKYLAHEFPDLTGISLAEFIRKCWCQEFESVDEMVALLRASVHN